MQTSPARELFWIYDSRTGRYAAIHRSGCGFCNAGTGMGGGYNSLLAEWRGPFRSLEEATQHIFGSHAFHQMRYCRRCV
jgi:hypothetical protein